MVQYRLYIIVVKILYIDFSVNVTNIYVFLFVKSENIFKFPQMDYTNMHTRVHAHTHTHT